MHAKNFQDKYLTVIGIVKVNSLIRYRFYLPTLPNLLETIFFYVKSTHVFTSFIMFNASFTPPSVLPADMAGGGSYGADIIIKREERRE